MVSRKWVRKEIWLDPLIVESLEKMAVKDGRSLKAYIEQLLTKHSGVDTYRDRVPDVREPTPAIPVEKTKFSLKDILHD